MCGCCLLCLLFHLIAALLSHGTWYLILKYFTTTWRSLIQMYEPIVNFITKFHKCTWGKLDEGHATWVLRQLRLNSETEMLFKKDEPSVAQIFWRSVLKFLGTTFSLVEHTCSWVERNAFLSSNSTSTLLSCNYKYTFLLNKQYISQATIYCHWLNHQATMHKLFSQAALSHFLLMQQEIHISLKRQKINMKLSSLLSITTLSFHHHLK